ncbi:MAG: hypothetical protein JWM56_21 [Candidatus Peribacteria bacterium]|nr:hypothetical protein [Candidatus Peribacteria bacterium]
MGITSHAYVPEDIASSSTLESRDLQSVLSESVFARVGHMNRGIHRHVATAVMPHHSGKHAASHTQPHPQPAIGIMGGLNKALPVRSFSVEAGEGGVVIMGGVAGARFLVQQGGNTLGVAQADASGTAQIPHASWDAGYMNVKLIYDATQNHVLSRDRITMTLVRS